MLKIKAERMGELEKMGFKKNKNGGYSYYLIWNYGQYVVIDVLPNRELALCVNYEDCYIDNLQIFYDLIKADMVEVCDD